jgi:hypothetical protein
VEEPDVEPSLAASASGGPGGASIDLAVLVYGLPAATIDRVVGDVLASLLGPVGVEWVKRAEFRGCREPC